MRTVRATEHRRMPWKNGGGETVEIAIDPPGASLDAFDWRVSIAHVAVDGPFSRFEGIDRTLTVIDGRGMVLTLDHRDHLLTVATPPLAFAGDVPTMARLVDGPIVDLNVMTRRGAWRHAVTRVVEPTTVGRPDGVTLVVARSALTVRSGDQVETLGVDDVAIAESLTITAVDQVLAYVIELSVSR